MFRNVCLISCLALAAAACGDDKKSVDVVAATLDFGMTDCGTTATPHILVVTNPGVDPITFTAALGKGGSSPYTVTPSTGSILGYAQLELTVYSKPIPAQSDTGDATYADTLTITTSLKGDSPHAVAVKQVAHGAILAASTATVDFPTATKLGSVAQTSALTIMNKGNADADLAITSSGESFTFTPGGPQTVAAAGMLAGQVSYSPRDVGALTETLSITSHGPTCAPPATVVATGTGTLTGMAVTAVPAVSRGRPRNGTQTLCVLTTAGFVACTGSDLNGMRANGDKLSVLSGFNLVRSTSGVLDNVTQLISGRGFYCAVRGGGDAWCWGDFFGLGHRAYNDPRSRNSYALQIAAAGVRSIAAGYAYTCVVTDPGGVVTCSGNPTGSNSAPAGDWAIAGAKAVTMSGGGGYALMTDGSITSFGKNSNGERGDSVASDSAPGPVVTTPGDPTTVFSNVTAVSAGGNAPSNGRRRHGCAITSDGSAWCWGKNRHGELGNNAGGDSNHPVQVVDQSGTPLANVTWISAGQSHTCAVAGGTVYCWGRDNEGELGQPGLGDTHYAVQPSPAITNATSVTALGRSTCAVLTTGGLMCWGQILGGNITTPTVVAAFGP